MKTNLRSCLWKVLAFSFCATGSLHAAVLSSYEFINNTPEATSISAGLSSSAIVRGSGLQAFTITANNIYGFPSGLFSGGNDGVLVIESGGTPNVAAAVSGNDYFELTITPDAGRWIEFSNLTFNAASTSDSQPRLFSIHANSGSGWEQVANSTGLSYTGGVSFNTIDLSGYSAVAAAITFRFYVVDGTNPPSTRRLGMDDLVFNGAVHSIPEPGGAFLLGAGAGLLVLTRRLRSS